MKLGEPVPTDAVDARAFLDDEEAGGSVSVMVIGLVLKMVFFNVKVLVSFSSDDDGRVW